MNFIHDALQEMRRKFYHFTLSAKKHWALPPNLVTMARASLALPVFLFALTPGWHGWLGFACYAAAVSTDWVDGWLAKRNDGRWTSHFGTVIDPIADKIINFTALAVLILRLDNPVLWWLVVSATAIIAVREVVVFLIRNGDPVTSASEEGRRAMFALAATIALLLLPVSVPLWLPIILVGISVYASLVSGWGYIHAHHQRVQALKNQKE